MTDKVPVLTLVAQWIADHLPRKIVYFCGMRMLANAAGVIGDDPTEMPILEVMGLWSDK
jgi:hypothetical protein